LKSYFTLSIEPQNNEFPNSQKISKETCLRKLHNISFQTNLVPVCPSILAKNVQRGLKIFFRHKTKKRKKQESLKHALSEKEGPTTCG
jgi:hypothetical protein